MGPEVAEIIMDIEDCFGLEISDDDKIDTVED